MTDHRTELRYLWVAFCEAEDDYLAAKAELDRVSVRFEYARLLVGAEDPAAWADFVEWRKTEGPGPIGDAK